MISRPQQDLRHTGHIGYDGAVFGDVSFIGDNYDKIPLQLNSQASSMTSIPRYGDSPDRENGHKGTNGLPHSWISSESLDVGQRNGTDTPPYQDINDDALFDFKIPDISSGFDFGPSFMDEVLRALDEKEKQLEASADRTLRDSPEKPAREASRSTSPDEHSEMKPGPPPLPTTLPRTLSKPDGRTEPKKQAKVKPMSASDQKMMEEAIAMANKFADESSRGQMIPEPASHSPPENSRGEKPLFDFDPLSKLKNSMKKSPKQDRKRTFSDNLASKGDISDELPPESQEAYNILVVKGTKDSTEELKSLTPERTLSSSGSTLVERRVTPERSLSKTPPTSVERTYNTIQDRSNNAEPVLPAATELSTVSATIRSPPPKPMPKPMPKPRVEIKRPELPPPAPRTEIPVPKPRPEVNVNRVEPVPRFSAPSPESSPKDLKLEKKTPVILPSSPVTEPSKLYDRKPEKRSIEIVRMDRSVDTVDKPPTASEREREEFSEKESTPETDPEPEKKDSIIDSLFDADDFEEPSPREIMMKLRQKRSAEHQRGVSSEELTAARNLREPQGIPVKSVPLATAEEDEEVDTNPLRMLRGGALPLRSSRGGAGTNPLSTKPTLRIPKLEFRNPGGFQHSVSVDSSAHHRQVEAEKETRLQAPKLVMRSLSMGDNSANPLPLPPRNPHRPGNLNAKPRERKYPLSVSSVSGSSTSMCMPSVSSVLNRSKSLHEPATCLPSAPRPDLDLSRTSRPDLHRVPPHDLDLPTTNRSPLLPPRHRPSRDLDLRSNHRPDLDLPPAPPPPLDPDLHLDDYYDDEDSVFTDHRQPCRETVSVSPPIPSRVECSLENLGFYNSRDRFWGEQVLLPEKGSSESDDISPLLLANYKRWENVSYEDLLELALDREKNCKEIETMRNIFSNELSVEKCMKALQDTQWDLQKAVKYVKLKQLLSVQLGDVTRCKEALLRTNWDVRKAANFMLLQPLSSPDSVDV